MYRVMLGSVVLFEGSYAAANAVFCKRFLGDWCYSMGKLSMTNVATGFVDRETV